MPLENVVPIDPKNTILQKNTGGGWNPPLRPLTPEKYLGPEKVNVHPMRAGHILLQPMKSAGKSMGN